MVLINIQHFCSVLMTFYVQLLSCVQIFATLWTAMPGFPICHNLPDFAQTHVQSVSNAIQPSHPLLPSSPPAFSLSQHQGLFQRVSSLHQVAKALELQHQSLQLKFRIAFLYDWLVWSPCCPRDSQESSPAPQFERINSLAFSPLYSPTLTSIHDYWKNHSFDYRTFVNKVTSLHCLGLS